MSKAIRAKQIADVVKRAVVEVLTRELRDPRIHDIIITDVEMADNLALARIFFTVNDVAAVVEYEKLLNKAASFVRHQIASKIELRYTPKLRFIYDASIRRGERIDDLLSDNPNPPEAE